MEAIFSHVPVGLYRSSMDGRLLHANPALASLLGYGSVDELLTLNMAALYVDVADRQRLLSALDRDGATAQIEALIQRKDGSTLWVEVFARRVDEAGGFYLAGMVSDITTRKTAEAEAARFMRAASASGEIIFMTDRNGVFTYVNPEFSRVYGYAPEEVIGQHTPRLLKSGLQEPEYYAAFWRDLLAGHRVRGEFTNRRKDSTLVPIDASASAVMDPAGAITGFLAIQRDITARRRTENALHESEAMFRRTFDQLPVGAALVATDGRIHRANAALCRMLGRTEDELKASTISDYTHAEDMERTVEVMRDVITGTTEQLGMEKRYVRKDGSQIWADVSVRVVRDSSGKPMWLMPVMIDITDRRRLQDQYLQAQKLEAVGRLAGGVAHDFNNLLTAILGYTDLLLEQLADSPIGEDLRHIQHAGQRAARLTHQLLAFSRKQVMRVTAVDVNALVGSLREMSQRLLGEDICLRVNGAPDLWSVRADPTQLEQVFMNLVVNSRDALPQGGSITVATRNVTVTARDAEAMAGARAGDYVVLIVSDDGHGMDEETKRRLFEPFFTTKDAGKGTGLGLATVYGIVQQSGGFITVDSRIGAGTTMKVFLPATTVRPSAVPDDGPRRYGIAPGRERILVVEDQPEVRRFAVAALRRYGYDVLEATSGEEAVKLFRDADQKPVLLFTDVVLPGVRGPQVAKTLRETDPQLKVLFTSGYSQDLIAHDGVLDDGVELLQKPFTSNVLLTRIAGMLRAAV